VTYYASPNVTFKVDPFNMTKVMKDLSRMTLLMSKYDEMKFVANDNITRDYKIFLQETVYDSILKGANQTDNKFLSVCYNTSSQIVQRAIDDATFLYTCFSKETEKDLDFVFRASSYTFFVSVVFMFVQVVAVSIFAYHVNETDTTKPNNPCSGSKKQDEPNAEVAVRISDTKEVQGSKGMERGHKTLADIRMSGSLPKSRGSKGLRGSKDIRHSNQ